jgi:hypothetical protein
MPLAARVHSLRFQPLLHLQKRSRRCLMRLILCRKRLLFLREELQPPLRRRLQKRSRRCLMHLILCRKRLLFLREELRPPLRRGSRK